MLQRNAQSAEARRKRVRKMCVTSNESAWFSQFGFFIGDVLKSKCRIVCYHWSMESIRLDSERSRVGPEGLNAPIDVPAGFSQEAKLQTAEWVLEQVRNGVDRWLLEKSLYVYLTQKVSDAELVAIESSFNKVGAKEKYYAVLRRVAQEASLQGLTVNNDVAWFSLYGENLSAQKKERMARTVGGKTESVEISYKECFSVPIKSKDAQQASADIERFQNVLLRLAKELANVAQSENDQIKMKVPGNLQSFIKHPDSLVVHYRNPALSEKIRHVVERELGSVGFETMRENRTASGFDFDSENDLYNGSHSSLMASVAADTIIEHVKANPQLAQATAEQFIPFLDRAFGQYAALSPKELLSRLDKVKN